MPTLLRKIRKARWRPDEFPWAPPGDICADPLGDLATSGGRLSVWRVEHDRSNLNRIITALAATSDTVSNFDYVVVDAEAVAKLNIAIDPVPGETPDAEANRLWHFDLIELTTEKLPQLARACLTEGKRERVSEKQVLTLIAEAVTGGLIRPDQLRESLRRKLPAHPP